MHAAYTGLPIPHPYYLYLDHDKLGDVLLALAAQNPRYTLFRPARARSFALTADGASVEDADRASARRRAGA